MTNDFADRVGIGVCQGMGTDYPFINPLSDVAGLLADLYLSVDAMSPDGTLPSGGNQLTFPWIVSWLHGLGTVSIALSSVHPVDLLIVSSNNHTVFDSTVATYSTLAFGPNMTIPQWQTATAVCRIVTDNAQPADGETYTYSNDINPVDGRLDIRTCHLETRRIRRLYIGGGDTDATNIKLMGGYNTALSSVVTAGTILPDTQITIAMAPGDGLGTYTDCVSVNNGIQKINGVTPDAGGNFSIGGQSCVNVFQPTTVTATSPRLTLPATLLDSTAPNLVIRDDCAACCSCGDFVTAADKIVSVYNQYAPIAAEMQATRTQYNANVERWTAGADCRSGKALYVAVQAQACPFIDVLAQYINQSSVCQHNLELRIRCAASPDINGDCTPGAESLSTVLDAPASHPAYRSTSVTVLDGSTSQSLSVPQVIALYTLQGTWCDYRAFWSAVNPFDTVYVKFRLRFPYNGVDPSGNPYGLTVWLDGQVGGQWLQAANGSKLMVSASTATRCGTAGV